MPVTNLASLPGLLAPAFGACSPNTLVLQATNVEVKVRRPGNEAITNHASRVVLPHLMVNGVSAMA